MAFSTTYDPTTRVSLKESPDRPDGCSCKLFLWSRWTTAGSLLVPWTFDDVKMTKSKTISLRLHVFSGIDHKDNEVAKQKKLMKWTMEANTLGFPQHLDGKLWRKGNTCKLRCKESAVPRCSIWGWTRSSQVCESTQLCLLPTLQTQHTLGKWKWSEISLAKCESDHTLGKWEW